VRLSGGNSELFISGRLSHSSPFVNGSDRHLPMHDQRLQRVKTGNALIKQNNSALLPKPDIREFYEYAA